VSKFIKPLLVVATVGWLAACNSTESSGIIKCTLDLKPAIVVKIRDAASQLPAADGATGYVRDGSYVDSLEAYGETEAGLLSMQAARERPGTYTVIVMKDGYQTWERQAVKVGHDVCHVQTVTLTADLVSTTE